MNQLLGHEPSAPPPAFTERQGQYLAFIWAYTQIHARPPAERDLQHFFDVTAPSVHQMILTLQRQGLIRRQPATARSIELLIPPETLPVLRSPRTVKTSETRY
jgi:DNA-binding MarR family transcriptional regulator